MNITANGKSIENILSGPFYKIPRFQRPYSWDRSNVEYFLTDVIESTRSYFIGSMVVYRDGDASGLIDGQQRLTTITMLLAALRNKFSALGADKESDGLHTLIERTDTSGRQRFVLETESSYPYLQGQIQAMPGDVRTAEPAKSEERALADAFKIVTDKVDDLTKHIDEDPSIPPTKREAAKVTRLKNLRDSLLSLTLVLIEVDDEDHATTIFQTLNSRGKDLEVADLVKSHVLSMIRAQNAQLDEARDDWNAILESFDESAADISTNRFILHFWHSRHDYVAEKGLFRLVKNHVKRNNARDFLDQLGSDAILYRIALEPDYNTWKKPQLPVRASLRALNLFRMRQPLPMVLSLLREYGDQRIALRHLREGITGIEHYHFIATAVTNQPSSGGVSRMYASAARRLTQATSRQDRVQAIRDLIEKLRSRKPSLEEFSASFLELRSSKQYTQQATLVRYILERVYTASMRPNTAAVDFDEMTVEHIASQGQVQKKHSVDASDLARIGNLILVPRSVNEALANKSFSEKQRVLASLDYVDGEVVTASAWSAEEIKARTQKLAEIAYNEVWQL